MASAPAPAAAPAPTANPVPAPAPAAAPGGKKGKNVNPKKPQVTTSSATQRLFASEVKVSAIEEHTEYFLDMQAVLNLASNFDTTVREQHRRGGHPANFVYHALFFKSMAAKLQAVGVETFQIRVNDDCKIGTEGILLPQVLTHAIAQFGIAYDGMGVKLYPKVTTHLIRYLNHLANCCIASHDPALTNVVNHQNFYELVYGTVSQSFIGLLQLRDRLGIRAIAFNTHDIDGVDQLGRGIFTEYCISQGAYPTQAVMQATAGGAFGAWFLSANGVPAAGATPIALPLLVQHADAVRVLLVNAANPFAANALPANLNAANAQTINPAVVRSVSRYLCTIYNCSAPVINGTGSLAPLISVDIVARRVTASSFLFDCPVRDYVIAMSMLGCHNIIVKRAEGCIFNVATQASQEFGYEASAMKMSFNEALIAVFDDCLK